MKIIYKKLKETSINVNRNQRNKILLIQIKKKLESCAKIFGKNCASLEKAVTTSEILTEYTMRSCATIAFNDC